MKKVLVIGELNVDLILSGCHALPEPGKEILAERFQATLGSASAICAVGLARLGTPVAFVGKIGADDWGAFCLRALRAAGIDVSRVVEDPALETGVTVALSTPADRALVTFLGSVRALTGTDIAGNVLAGFDHLHVSSYFLQQGLRPHVKHLFAGAHRRGLTTSLDPGFDPDERWGADLVDALAEADLFLPNEVELRAVTGCSDPAAAVRALGAGRTRVVAKLGAQGAMTLEAGELVHVPALPVTPIDTTGAGDSFNAGFLHGWLAGRSLRAALQLGAACGALSTLGVGGTARQPSLVQAEAFLAEHVR
jgi:sugar/nucleoside kinase (ribokinase family)